MAASGRTVLVHWRDLGAHAGVSRHAWGPTLTRRMVGAALLAKPISSLLCDHESKVKLVRIKLLPAALYGAESTFAADASLRRLRGAIFLVLRPNCEMGGGQRGPPLRGGIGEVTGVRR